MGTVYKALHKNLNRTVAVKVLAIDRMGDERALARFQREMRAVGQLHHPNIIQAHDAREFNGTWFLVMEWAPGLDLGRLVNKSGPLGIAEACEVIRQTALGLQHAHEHSLVHRDVKPSNLLLTPQGEVKILDLGLALLRNERASAETSTPLRAANPNRRPPGSARGYSGGWRGFDRNANHGDLRLHGPGTNPGRCTGWTSGQTSTAWDVHSSSC